jgi:hypothetical protein
MSNFPRKLLSLTADPGQFPTGIIVTVSLDALVKNEKRDLVKVGRIKSS